MNKRNRILNWVFLIGIWTIPLVLLVIIPTSEIPALTVFLNAFASVVLIHDWFMCGYTNSWKGIATLLAIALILYIGFAVLFLLNGISEFGLDEFVALHSNRYMFIVFFMLYSLVFAVPRLVVAKVLKIDLSIKES